MVVGEKPDGIPEVILVSRRIDQSCRWSAGSQQLPASIGDVVLLSFCSSRIDSMDLMEEME